MQDHPDRFTNTKGAVDRLAHDYQSTTGVATTVQLQERARDGEIVLELVVSVDGVRRAEMFLGSALEDDAILAPDALSIFEDYLTERDRAIWPACPVDGKPLALRWADGDGVWICH